MSAPPDGPRRRAPRRRRARLAPWAVVLVVAAVIAAGEVAARAVGPEIPREAGSEERLLIKSDQIFDRGPDATQIAVFGSSDTAGGLVPGVVAEQAPGVDGIYNAALAGMTVDRMHEWAERIVVPHLQPDIAVIGILPMSVQDGSQFEDLAILEDQAAAGAAYSTAMDQVDPGTFGDLGWQLRNRSALFRWRPYLRSPSLVVDGVRELASGDDSAPEPADTTVDWLTETDPDRIAANTAPTGEVFDYRSPSVPTDADPLGASLYTTFAEGAMDLDDLEAFVAMLEDRGVQPAIVIAPVDRSPLEAGGADLAPLDQVARAVVAWGEERGIPVDDQFTEAWAPTSFHDRNHLDEGGAVEWSTEVGAWIDGLCRDGALPDCAPA